MRNLIYTFGVLFVLVFQTHAQDLVSVDTLVEIKSQLKSVYTDRPVSDAHIINPGLSIGTTSDSLGFFSIYMRRNDSLLISVLAFEDLVFSLPIFWPSSEYSKTIYLRETAYLIEEVNIHGLGSYEQFKEKVLNARPPEPPAEKTREYINKMATTEAQEWQSPRVGFSFSMKTKEEKSRKKLEKILAEIEKRKLIERKFNSQNVGTLTGLSGQDLERFMDYCKLPEEFLLNASEYDILVAVKRAYENYKPIRQNRNVRKNNF